MVDLMVNMVDLYIWFSSVFVQVRASVNITCAVIFEIAFSYCRQNSSLPFLRPEMSLKVTGNGTDTREDAGV